MVTGVSPSSIGSGLALAIASQSPLLLILASRTLSNIQTVTSSIHALYPSTPIKAVALDLSNLNGVRSAADEIKKTVGDGEIDVLFNNAGINISWRELTSEGYELQFATNHLGGFLLTSLLMPLMLSPVAVSWMVGKSLLWNTDLVRRRTWHATWDGRLPLFFIVQTIEDNSILYCKH